MDIARANFIWDSGKKMKYHMIRWEVMARRRRIGGLGFTDTRLMNGCLLTRWIVKIDIEDMMTCIPTSLE
jgi:hypothetical protein